VPYLKDISELMVMAYSSRVHPRRFPYTVLKWGRFNPSTKEYQGCIVQAYNEYISQNIFYLEKI
jgi:hypothetical protein